MASERSVESVARPLGTALPFQIGALYNRKAHIHALLGGQQQGGISTPPDQPFVIIFTGEAGKSHGYTDRWDDDYRNGVRFTSPVSEPDPVLQ